MPNFAPQDPFMRHMSCGHAKKNRLQTNWRYYNTSPLKIQYNPINSQIIQHLCVSENRFQDAFSHISLFSAISRTQPLKQVSFLNEFSDRNMQHSSSCSTPHRAETERNFRHTVFFTHFSLRIFVTHVSLHFLVTYFRYTFLVILFCYIFISRIFVTPLSEAPLGVTHRFQRCVCLVLRNTD